MANTYNNLGPVTVAENIRDVTNNYNYNVHHEVATKTNTVATSTVPPRKIAFKPIPKPHGAFIGRVEYINKAIKNLCRPVVADVQIQFPCLIIHALGGYGKTQTAKKIASLCRKKRKFHHFIWIDSGDDMSIKKCFDAARKEIGLDSSDETDLNLIMHQFYNFLLCWNKEKFLIIFDNVEDFDKILKYLPFNYRASNIAVLMTSQHLFTQKSYGNVRNQRLDLMLAEEAVELVENILGSSSMDSKQDKKLLVERSGRITLVLCVMTSTIKFQRNYNTDYRIKDYLNQISYEPIQYSDESNVLDLTYEKSLRTIVRFAVDKLDAIGGPIEKIAVKIFDRMAYCSSTNELTEFFVKMYLQDICKETENVDIKLPMKPTDDMQIIRMGIQKLSEFSLVEFSNDVFAVHRWIQASRRLDLKNSGDDERNVLNELLSIVPDMTHDHGNTSIIWQHVADYADLVNDFYMRKRTLLEFPILDMDAIEKIIGALTQNTDLEQFENFPNEIDSIIENLITFSSSDALECVVDAFNYDVSKKSGIYISFAIFHEKLDVLKWLINEKSCIPEENNLRECFISVGITVQKLKDLGAKNEKKSGKNLLDRIFNYASNKSKSFALPCASQSTESPEVSSLLSALEDLDGVRELIEEKCGIKLDELNKLKQRRMFRIAQCKRCTRSFEMIKVLLYGLGKLEPSPEFGKIMEKYSETNLIECLLVCGRTHVANYVNGPEDYSNWNGLQRTALRNDLTAIIATGAIESKTSNGMTPLMCVVKAGACEATTDLLEKYSANINAMDNDGYTPLAHAIVNHRPSIVEILLCHGAKTHWKTKCGLSVHALHEAVKAYRVYDTPEPQQIFEAVLASTDCDVSATDLQRNNILHLLVEYYYATRYKPNHRVLQVILSVNASLVNMENNDGLTPLQLATNFLKRFTDNHWHAQSLKSFISELEKVGV